MRTITALVTAILIHAVSATIDARAARPTFALGAGYSGSTVNADVDRGDMSEFTFDGVTVFARIGLRPRWGIHLAISAVEDGESFSNGEDISIRVVHLHAYRSWRPDFHFRPHVKFGLMWMDFETDHGAGPTVESDDVSPSVGLGFEWGSPRVGAFVDVGFAPADIELDAGVEESLFVGNTAIGFFYRFGQGNK